MSANMKMRLQKWVGKATSSGRAKPEREEKTQLGINTTGYAQQQADMATLHKDSLAIPTSTSRAGVDINTCASCPDSLSAFGAVERAFSERSIPLPRLAHGMRGYSSTGNLLARRLENASGPTRGQSGRNENEDSAKKKLKARSAENLITDADHTDTKYRDQGIHNKRALFKANNRKRTRQTSTESLETLSSENSDRYASFGTSLEEPGDDEKFAEEDLEKLSEQINARLQKWANLAQEKRERRPSEEDSSGSSSDCATDASPSTQAKEILELESALKELVGNATNNVRTRRRSRCDLLDGFSSANTSGQRSRKSSGQENCSSPDISEHLSEKGDVDEVDGGLLESQEAHERALVGLARKRERTAEPQDGDGENTAGSDGAKSSNELHTRRSKVCSSNSTSSAESDISHQKQRKNNSVSSIGSSSSDGALRDISEGALRDISDGALRDISDGALRDISEGALRDISAGYQNIPNIVTSEEPQNENSEIARNSKDELASTNGHSKASGSQNGGCKVRFEGEDEISEIRCKNSAQASTAGGTQSIRENANISALVESCKVETSRRPCIIKRRSVPNTAVYNLKMRADVRESMRQFLNFNDTDLSEFAVECVRHANKKKQRLRKKNSAGVEESCSGSDDNASERAAGALRNIGEGRNPLEEEHLNENREFAGEAEKAGTILASQLKDAPSHQRLYKFPSLPMFYHPDETANQDTARPPMRSGRALPLHNVSGQDLKKSSSVADLRKGGTSASDGKPLARNSIPSPGLFFTGDVPMRDGSDKAAKLKRNLLRPRSWLGKFKDENDNIQRGDKKLSTKSKRKDIIRVSMEALI